MTSSGMTSSLDGTALEGINTLGTSEVEKTAWADDEGTKSGPELVKLGRLDTLGPATTAELEAAGATEAKLGAGDGEGAPASDDTADWDISGWWDEVAGSSEDAAGGSEEGTGWSEGTCPAEEATGGISGLGAGESFDGAPPCPPVEEGTLWSP